MKRLLFSLCFIALCSAASAQVSNTEKQGGHVKKTIPTRAQMSQRVAANDAEKKARMQTIIAQRNAAFSANRIVIGADQAASAANGKH